MRRAAIVAVALALAGCPGSDPAPADDTSSTGGPGTSSDSSSSTTPADSSESSTAADTSTAPGTSESSTADSSSSGDTGEVVLHGACELADRVGGFVLLRDESYTTFSGAVADGVVPAAVLENIGEEGDCRLLRRNNPFCDPACGPGQTCDFDGSCIPYPTNHDVGTVEVTGLLQAVSVEPIQPTNDYFDTSLPHPAWDPAALVRLSAAGGDYEAFELVGYGVSMIEPDPDPVVIDPMSALTIEWTPDAGEQQVRVELTIDLHGATPSKLVCETADTGMLTISQQLVADFVALGVTGFPTVTFHRETVDSVELTPGCVELAVRSYATGELSVIGHTPCTNDDQCPKGQECDEPNETCVDP